MKIGILSLVLHTNYGGILQSYALQTILIRMGHEVLVLNKEREIHKSLFRQTLSYMKYFVSRYLLRRNIIYRSANLINKDRHEREVHTSSFIDKYIHTRLVARITNDTFRDMDAVIVGSDQVFRPRYFKKLWKSGIENAFLSFLGEASKKRIAYAASFGTDEWEYTKEETARCADLLQRFDAVSVRESSAVRFCREYLCYDKVSHVLDPTMLLMKEDYVRLVESVNTPKSKGNLMCFILDKTDDKQQLVERIAAERGLTPFNTKAEKGCLVPSVEQWLRGFMDAEFVVTDSFHACVFSIIFCKPFVVVGNKERGMSRFDSLLSMFSLQSHLLYMASDYDPRDSYAIDANVTTILDEKKKESLLFLSKILC